jgi:hypothetical protein
MNGTNSNTSGTNVASVGFWPLGILPNIVAAIGNLLNDIKKVASGDATALKADFAEKSASDALSDMTMEEIARRLIITMEQETPGNVVFSPTEPEDKTKAWWQTDAQTGIPLGQPKIYKANTDKWEPIVAQESTYVPPARRALKKFVPAGGSAQNFTFEDLKTDNYTVSFVFTTEQVSGGFATAPVSFPTAFGYIVSNKTNNTLTVQFYGVPSGGMMVDGYVESNS